MWWAIIGSLIGGFMQKNAADKAAAKALEIGNANADDLIEATDLNADEAKRIADLNNEAILDTATNNATSARKVGELNALAHIEAGAENVDIADAETGELLRRHKLKSVALLNQSYAAMGASGVRASSGSFIEVLAEQVEQGFNEQEWIGRIGHKKMAQMAMQAGRQGVLTWIGADERAKTMLYQAAQQAAIVKAEGYSQAEIMVRNAELNAASLRRGGSLLSMQYTNQGNAAMISGILGGLNIWAGMN